MSTWKPPLALIPPALAIIASVGVAGLIAWVTPEVYIIAAASLAPVLAGVFGALPIWRSGWPRALRLVLVTAIGLVTAFVVLLVGEFLADPVFWNVLSMGLLWGVLAFAGSRGVWRSVVARWWRAAIIAAYVAFGVPYLFSPGLAAAGYQGFIDWGCNEHPHVFNIVCREEPEAAQPVVTPTETDPSAP